MTAPRDECPFVFDSIPRFEGRAPEVEDPGDPTTGAEPAPEVGVIRLLAPPTSVFVALRQAHLLLAWEARFEQALAPMDAILGGDAACGALEEELESSMATLILAIGEHEERMIPVQSVAAGILASTTDLWCLRHLLDRLQRALHAARQPWDVLQAVRTELAPWRARLAALERALVGQLAANFAFLQGEVALHAGSEDDGMLFVDVAYSPQVPWPPNMASRDPWLTLGFAEALRGQPTHPHPACRTCARMEASPPEGASRG